ncbi:hypothetical protein CI109_101117 [Kwoniella shandongensis]|uniref:tRNA-splicing endonuclease subunit Sen34 n=1 Tax=Kwoniella shandongensis TaxID=1734106 RepID=A0A5M6C5X0_9TREE|nr:uncharacterized protein CI109_001587 [Kwoniella shandongensis]KAA5530181.1 hypothetical protein CI109_001587 [Kwoniella shandongensis]
MASIPKNGEPSTRQRTAPKDGSIALYLVNGVATVWDAQVAATLHCVHSVSGLRAGTLPGVSQQNGFLGLPLTLMQEETAYLVTQGIAHLIPLSLNPTVPSPSEIAQHTAARIKRVQALEQRAKEDEIRRRAASKAEFEKAGEEARAKREKRAKAKAEKERAKRAAEAGDEGGEGLFGGDERKDVTTKENDNTETSKSTLPTKVTASTPAVSAPVPDSTPSPGYFHTVPSHPVHSTTSSSQNVITTLPHPLFPFPTTPRDHALLGVFTTLQSLNLRMGLGPRFGGEYLIYPGDYLRYHAHFTSQVIVRDEPIRPAEIVAWGRLGTGTKKAGLICCWDDGQRGDKVQLRGDEEKKAEVEFYSLEWANFG